MKKTNYLGMYSGLLVIALLLGVCSLVSAKTKVPSDGDVKKADYFFLEAVRQKAHGHKDAYYALIEQAYNLNPKDKYVAMQEGTRRLLLTGSDEVTSPKVDEALRMVKEYVMDQPDDIYSGAVYAKLSKLFGRPDEAVDTWRMLYEHDQRTDIGINYVDALLESYDSTQMATALTVLDTLERVEGIAPEFALRRMRVYQGFNDTLSLKREAHKLLDSSPSDINYLSFIGNIYAEFGDVDSAKIFFDRAVELEPDNGLTYYNRAIYYKNVGDSIAYDREVNQVMLLPEMEVEAKLDILRDYVVQLYMDSTQHGRISDIFYTLIDQYPHEAMVRKLFADYLVVIHDYVGAAEQKSYELDLDPKDPNGWEMLSSIYLSIGDYPHAQATTKRGLRYFPEESSLYVQSSLANNLLQEYDTALVHIKKAIEFANPNDLETLGSCYAQAGDIYHNLNMPDSVDKYYDLAILYDSSNLIALNNYAYYLSCRKDGNLDKALQMIERVMAEEKDNITSLDTYAWVLFKRKNYEKAREVIDKAIELSEEATEEIYEHAGDIYFMDGKPEEALVFWLVALKLNPDNELLQKKVKHKTFFYE